MKEYKTTVGLEVHAELKTNSKMFCPCKNDPHHAGPNELVCPICMGHPGTLPTLNKEAIKSVLKVGYAINGTIADFTEFDRKNYFYPDIPKGYQISQYKYPLVKGGEVANVKITRVHLEEDTASSSHEGSEYSLVDFNRAGVPLMELVTEPVIHTAEEAGNFGRELQLLLRTLGVSEANMEKGEMRVEANISVSNTDKFGTKVEVKNLNSFKVVEKAIEYETKRHIELLERGEKIVQETRGWDDGSQKTYSQRAKEDSHDYRYFPDPDLPKLKISEIPEFSKENLIKELPELPEAKRLRFAKEYGLKPIDIHIYVSNPKLATFFEGAVSDSRIQNSKFKIQNFGLVSNYILTDLVGILKKKHGEDYEKGFEEMKVTSENIASIVSMIETNKISSRGAKDILAEIFEKGGEPEKIAKEKGLFQVSDAGAIIKIAEDVIKANPKVVEEYKNGKEASIMFLVGAGMKISKGSANPQVLKEAIQKILKP